MNDQEMNEILHEWKTPEAPLDLEARVWAKRKAPGWRWWLTGSIRIPVPAFVLALIVLAALFFAVRRPAPRAATQTGLAGFQPVKEFAPRIVGSKYEVH